MVVDLSETQLSPQEKFEEENKNFEMFESQQASKSAVKLIKNSRGVNWEIKVVTGEEDTIEQLKMIALRTHRELESDLNGVPFEE